MLRVLYLDTVVGTETGTRYPYYQGLMRGLQHVARVTHLPTVVSKARVDNCDPDLVVLGLGLTEDPAQAMMALRHLRGRCVVSYVFKPQNMHGDKLRVFKNTIMVTPTPHRFAGSTLLAYGFDPSLFKEPVSPKYDVGFSGALHQTKYYGGNHMFDRANLRPNILTELDKHPGLKVYWKSSDNYRASRIHDVREYAATIAQSKVWIATLGPLGDVTPRYYEVMGSGVLLLCEKPPDCYNSIFRDGENCITFESARECVSRLRTVLADDLQRRRIAKQGHTEAHSKHRWVDRAHQVIAMTTSPDS